MEPAFEEVAHLLLTVGRLLMADGAEAEQVAATVNRLGERLGFEVHLLVTYESLLLTLVRDGRFRTKAGRHLPGFGVNMRAVEAISRIVADVMAGRLHPAEAVRRLEAAERDIRGYPKVATIAGMGVTAACLARLFGGDVMTCAIVTVAGGAGTWLRLALGARSVNPFLIAFLTAVVSGGLGALGARFLLPQTPALCLIAPGMILVPGVPLINGIWDCVRNHMTLGLGRLAAATLTVLAIATGLFCVTLATGVALPIGGGLTLLPLWQDAVIAGIAAVGFAMLFNVPPRLIAAAVLCGAASHGLRTSAMMLGLSLAPATLVGATGAGILALGLAWRFRVPPAAFAFPGVVAMVPGSFAFKAVIGAIGIVGAGDAAGHALVAQTISLTIGSALTMGAIAVGLSVPLALLPGLMRHGAPGQRPAVTGAPARSDRDGRPSR